MGLERLDKYGMLHFAISAECYMSKICLQNAALRERYDEPLHTLQNLYTAQFYYLSTSIDMQKLGAVWENFYRQVQEEKCELSCVLAYKMLDRDDFAFAVYKKISDHFITIRQALDDPSMNKYLENAGLTDDSLAYLNALDYFDKLYTLNDAG
ncbi:MAG: hypothetical protein ACHP6I_02975 [Rickettsiales bacterium]